MNSNLRIGIHRAHNSFPKILKYIIPVRLTILRPYIYKWLWFFIVTPEGSRSEKILSSLDKFRTDVIQEFKELRMLLCK